MCQIAWAEATILANRSLCNIKLPPQNLRFKTAVNKKACRSGYTSMYFRAPRLFQDLTVSRLGNKYSQYLNKLAKVDVLVIDDFGLAPMTEEQSRDLLEVVDDRCGKRPMIIASQLPPENWYGTIPSATIADAILDRIIHSSHKLAMAGRSRRRNKNEKTHDVNEDSTIDADDNSL
jgi:DNA replication protein DnaC